MVATIGIRAPAAEVTTVATVITAGIRAPAAEITTVYNIPTIGLRAAEAVVTNLTKTTNTIRAAQAQVTTIVKGRIENRKARCWPGSLDGHDLYVLRLGDTRTLVYDLTTDCWMEWADPDAEFWRPQCGMNWFGMGNNSFTRGITSDLIAGDDNFGLLWVVEPERGYDEAPRDDLPDAAFTRRVVGGVPMRMRATQKVGAVYATIDGGDPQFAGGAITLRTSDDNGETWQDHGTITIEPGNWNQEIVWRSIGLIKAPGRIFELTDNGATVRIDGLDMR